MMAAAVALLLALSWGGRKFDWISWRDRRAAPGVGDAVGAVRLAADARRRSRSCRSRCSAIRWCARAALAGACTMATLVGMTIMVPLYFETVLHLSAGQSGMALIPQMGATVRVLDRLRPADDAPRRTTSACR